MKCSIVGSGQDAPGMSTPETGLVVRLALYSQLIA
jgi:hypothetical protein